MAVQGHIAPGFEPVRDIFEQQFETGQNLGAGVAVYHRGELVVDLWGGVADEATGAPWKRDTMALSYSTTKGLTATCLHLLADRGLIDYAAPVSACWPGFERKGKAGVTVYHLLTHQAGLPLIPEGITTRDLLDWERMVAALTDTSPIWEPGTATGYHALTFGWLVGEVVRRVDGRDLGRFLREEVCEPLGIDGMYIGLPPALDGRVAPLVQRFELTPEMIEQRQRATANGESLFQRTSPADGLMNVEFVNSPDTWHAQIPAISGIMTARDLARMYACLANYGELDGVRLMREETVRSASRRQSYAPDRVIVLPVAFSLGYMNGAPGWPQGDRETAFGHPGFGGSVGFADPEISMGFGFVCNALTLGLTGAGRATALADAARASIAALA